MNPAQVGTKRVLLTAPGALVDNASLTVAELDTKGFDYCTIVLLLGATDIACTAAKITESDTSGTSHADVTGLVFGTSTNVAGSTSTLPSATDDDKFFEFQIDLRYRKRYLDATITVGDGTAGGYYVVWAELSRAKEPPFTATERGISQILRV